MKYSLWVGKIGVLIGAGCTYLAGQYFRGVWWPSLTWPFSCAQVVSGSITYCDPLYRDPFDLSFSLIAAGEIFALAGIILLFANRAGLRRWAKMSLVYIPLSFLIVASAPPQEGGIFFTTGFPHEFLVWVLGVPYLLATLVVVAWSRYRG